MSAPQQYYELYRSSSVGESLVDTIDDLIEDGRIEPQLALKVLANFDRVVAEVLAEKVKSRLTFKGHLETYRFCDDVWTFLVKDVKFKSDTGLEFQADKVKIVSCNSKRPAWHRPEFGSDCEIRGRCLVTVAPQMAPKDRAETSPGQKICVKA